VEVEVDVPPSALPVGAETAAVERLLVPLIENSCRYAAKTVRVRAARADGEVQLSVEDDGPGVDESVRAALFEPGVRTPGGDGAHNGAGLGLALARRLAQALDGDVEYVPGAAGATFRARLPTV
jgi:signal transduction histidine kinase